MINHLVPSEFYLSQNYPNPFKDKTVIKYCVAYKTNVQITIYDSEGNVIEKLVDEEKQPGTYQVEFSICHSRESAVGGGNLPVGRHGLPDGYYYYRLKANDYTSERKWFCINNLLRSNTMRTFLQSFFLFLFVMQSCF